MPKANPIQKTPQNPTQHLLANHTKFLGGILLAPPPQTLDINNNTHIL